MAKHKKKKNKPVKATEAKTKKPFPIKRALILFVITTVIFIAYRVMIALEITAAVHIYWIGLGVLAMAYIAINRGTFRALTPEKLSDELSNEEKTAIINDQARRLKLSRPILYVIIAIIFTLVYDTAYLFATMNLGLKI